MVLRERFGVSQRRACKVVGQHRSTERLAAPVATDAEVELRAWLRAFSRERPRWGWRRAATELRRQGRRVNNKRVHRLWREEGLKVPYRKRKKPHRGKLSRRDVSHLCRARETPTGLRGGVEL